MPNANIEDIATRFDRLKCLEKAVEAELEELGTDIRNIMAEQEGPLITNAGTFKLSTTNKRSIQFKYAWSIIWSYIDECDPGEREQIRADFEECVAIGVTALDKFIRQYPVLKDDLHGGIIQTPNDKTTLRFTRAK